MPRNGQSRIHPETFVYADGHSTGEHRHETHQLVYASHGLLCVDTATARWVLPPLRAAWVPAGVPHTVIAKADSEMSTLYVDGRVALEGLDTVTVITVGPLLRELIHHLQTADLDGAQRARVEDVILDQLRVARVAPLERRLLRDPRLRAIADVYEANPRDQRNLRELGEHIGASERTLQRLFHRETGTTFGRWRTQVRLHHAIVSLGQGHTVTTAATEAGYRETSAFIAAFRKTFGTTPGRYFTDDGV